MQIIKLSAVLIFSALFAGCSTMSDTDAYKSMGEAEIFQQGKSNVDNKRYAKAIKDFESLQARFPYGEYAEKAQISLIFAYYKKGDEASALASINHFLDLHPRHENSDYAMYMKGLVLYDQYYSTLYRYFPIDRSERDNGPAKKAFNAFKDLLETFPESTYALDAKQRMIQLRNQLAAHDLHIAKYYLDKKAYLAAANRAGHIVTEYNESESVPDALITMQEAYKQLGMHKLEADAKKTLELNFPEHIAKK